MLDYGADGNKYKNTDTYPAKKDYTVYYFYKQGVTLFALGYGFSDTSKLFELTGKTDTESALQAAKRMFTFETEVHPDYLSAKKVWADKNQALIEQWYSDLYSYYGVDKDDPVIQKIMSKAYEDGHAYGYSEVESHFSELLDFVSGIQDIMRKTPERYATSL